LAIGDTVTTDVTEKVLVLLWDTGVLNGTNPVYDRTRIPLNNSCTLQQVYDAAYAMAPYSSYSLAGIILESSDELGPID